MVWAYWRNATSPIILHGHSRYRGKRQSPSTCSGDRVVPLGLLGPPNSSGLASVLGPVSIHSLSSRPFCHSRRLCFVSGPSAPQFSPCIANSRCSVPRNRSPKFSSTNAVASEMAAASAGCRHV